MSLKIFEEIGKNNVLLSPSSHSIRLALKHMGISAEFVGIRPTEILNLKFKTVPVLKDERRIIYSGIEIAKYLERNFPSSPTLFGGEAGTYLAKFVNSYIEDGLYSNLVCFLRDEILENLEDEDKEIFLSRIILSNRNKKENLFEFNKKLNPIRITLKKQGFLFGERPGFVDYLVYGLFSWSRSLTGMTLLNRRDNLNNWKNRLDNIFDSKTA